MKKQLIALSLGLVLSAPSVKAQNAADPYVRDAKPSTSENVNPNDSSDTSSENISMTFETFSLELSQAAALMRGGIEDPALYAKLLELVEKNTAKQENFTIVRCLPGQQFRSQATSEQIYPTEYATPSLAAPVQAKEGEEGKAQPGASGMPVVPTAFETRNTGMTIEAEGTLEADRETVSIRVAPEFVTLVGRGNWGQGNSRTEMPEFEAQQLTSTFRARLNKPFLIGTLNRAPQSKVDSDAGHRVWFTFVTAKLVKL